MLRTRKHRMAAPGAGLFSLAMGAAFLCASCGPARAGDAAPPTRWREVWSGADVASDVWLLYSGVTIAPFSHIHGEGLRLRVVGGYGEYTFEDHFRDTGEPGTAVAGVGTFRGRVTFSDALVGYLWRLDPLTAKAFVGMSAIRHDIEPFGAQTEQQGLEIGPKGVIELWLNMGPAAWSSLDLNWTTAHDTGAIRFRTAYRVLPTVSAGIEAGVNASGELNDARGGAFLRYEWAGGEISAAAGLSSDFSGIRTGEADPYATVNWITQF